MRKFIPFLLKSVAILLVAMILLDILYTVVYLQSDSRSKIDYLYQSKNKNYDVVFLGSSRVNNHFIPKIFNDRGYKTFNFGITRSRLEESALMLELMLERNYHIKTLVLQVDLNINSNDHSEAIRSLFMPYLHVSKTIRSYYQNIPEYYALLCIPFYRYMHYDARIGFREAFNAAIHKKTNVLDAYGFHALMTNERPMVPADLSKYYPKRNKGYETIKKICKQHHIRLIALTTPMCKETINRTYFNHLHEIYPEILRFEESVTDDKYFSTCGHMNRDGAELFTKIVFQSLFNTKK
jgi:hypothetical protein